MKKLVYFHIIILLASVVFMVMRAPAQEKPKCPTARIAAPDTSETLQVWTLEAIVEGHTTEISYKWTLIIGHDEKNDEIHSGQGTSKITISKPDLQKGATVVVEIGGLPEGCFNRPTWSIIS